MNTAVIAFGSNLNQPIEQVLRAVEAVKQLPHVQQMRLSSLYRTAPVGYTDQPDFINAVAVIETELDALSLLHALQEIEQQFGRERSFQNAPRTLDLDIIDFEHQISTAPELILPHPRAHERGFVMIPLAEIAPDYMLGHYGNAQNLAAALGSDGLERLA